VAAIASAVDINLETETEVESTGCTDGVCCPDLTSSGISMGLFLDGSMSGSLTIEQNYECCGGGSGDCDDGDGDCDSGSDSGNDSGCDLGCDSDSDSGSDSDSDSGSDSSDDDLVAPDDPPANSEYCFIDGKDCIPTLNWNCTHGVIPGWKPLDEDGEGKCIYGYDGHSHEEGSDDFCRPI
jgi:hypothetical protein